MYLLAPVAGEAKRFWSMLLHASWRADWSTAHRNNPIGGESAESHHGVHLRYNDSPAARWGACDATCWEVASYFLKLL